MRIYSKFKINDVVMLQNNPRQYVIKEAYTDNNIWYYSVDGENYYTEKHLISITNKKSSTITNTQNLKPIHFKLANLLLEKIRNNNKNFKQPNINNWAKDFRLMIEKDKRKERDIELLILWCQQDNFWKKNILSPNKLRIRFDQLIITAKTQYKNQFNKQAIIV